MDRRDERARADALHRRLRAQRDALLAAVQAKQALMDHVVGCELCGYGDDACDEYGDLFFDEAKKRSDALALVRGEGE